VIVAKYVLVNWSSLLLFWRRSWYYRMEGRQEEGCTDLGHGLTWHNWRSSTNWYTGFHAPVFCFEVS